MDKVFKINATATALFWIMVIGVFAFYIIKQKNEQITALNMLNTYIHDLSKSNELSKDNIIDSEHEQQKIMREIKSIKQNLDSIIKPLQN